MAIGGAVTTIETTLIRAIFGGMRALKGNMGAVATHGGLDGWVGSYGGCVCHDQNLGKSSSTHGGENPVGTRIYFDM